MAETIAQFDFEFIWETDIFDTTITVAETDMTETAQAQVGHSVRSFATKIFDVRWMARRMLGTIERRGIAAYYYKAAYVANDRINSGHGGVNLSGTALETKFQTGRQEVDANPRIVYFDPIIIYVMMPNYISNLDQEEMGSIFTAETELTVPAIGAVARWDRLQVQDKNWIVIDEPQTLYRFTGEIIGFKLKCRLLRPGIIDY